MINRYRIAKDGKTNYFRWKGKALKRDIAEFGERVSYLQAGTRGCNKFESRWEFGIWLGAWEESAEIIIGLPEGIVKVRDFKRLGSVGERWQAQAVSGNRDVLWEPVPGQGESELSTRVHFPVGVDQPQPVDHGDDKTEIKRRVYMRRENIKRFGLAIGCSGCCAVNRNAPAQNHTEVCRERIEGKLKEEVSARLEEANERMQKQYLDGRVKRSAEDGLGNGGSQHQFSESQQHPSASSSSRVPEPTQRDQPV